MQLKHSSCYSSQHSHRSIRVPEESFGNDELSITTGHLEKETIVVFILYLVDRLFVSIIGWDCESAVKMWFDTYRTNCIRTWDIIFVSIRYNTRLARSPSLCTRTALLKVDWIFASLFRMQFACSKIKMKIILSNSHMTDISVIQHLSPSSLPLTGLARVCQGWDRNKDRM